MRVLLDEHIDRRLKREFGEGFEVATVTERGWNGKDNGELLRSAEEEFDAFVTMDKSIPHQQNVRRLDLVVVLVEAKSNRFEDLSPLMGRVKETLGSTRPGELARVAR